MNTLRLPTDDGRIEAYTLRGTPVAASPLPPARTRTAYAAAHVVAA
jgi:hypothetical protein